MMAARWCGDGGSCGVVIAVGAKCGNRVRVGCCGGAVREATCTSF